MIEIERFLSCSRREKVQVAKVVPDRNGNFTVKIPAPTGVNAAIYRALTKVARRKGGSSERADVHAAARDRHPLDRVVRERPQPARLASSARDTILV